MAPQAHSLFFAWIIHRVWLPTSGNVPTSQRRCSCCRDGLHSFTFFNNKRGELECPATAEQELAFDHSIQVDACESH
jgi:hypothetical protein